ncbi:hypothetical protein [Sinorhizobium fredii]|uniref:hypothetical protein n=1 Tax=Rhizobium fredii TaxID=380 RepID=UPI0004B84CA2|nr:hypothetical protein [Sinorhizobium fredii]AWM28115.1 hypothetical protein AOX55_00005337 [Sinorhizobium fredii CCBAU 25509]
MGHDLVDSKAASALQQTAASHSLSREAASLFDLLRQFHFDDAPSVSAEMRQDEQSSTRARTFHSPGALRRSAAAA